MKTIFKGYMKFFSKLETIVCNTFFSWIGFFFIFVPLCKYVFRNNIIDPYWCFTFIIVYFLLMFRNSCIK